MSLLLLLTEGTNETPTPGLIVDWGWEEGDSTPPDSETGGIAVVEVDPYSGSRHAEVDAADSTSSAHRAAWNLAGANNEDHFLRVVFKKLANPTSPVTICLLGSLANGHYGELQMHTDGTLKLRRNGTIFVGSPSAELSNGYHYAELRLRLGTSTTNGQIEGRIDGDVIAVNNATNLGTASTIDTLRVGVTNATGGTGGTTFRFDKVALSNVTWPGEVGASKAPTVTTGESSGVGGAVATLKGTVNPNGQPTDYWFEYGPTTSYGSQSPDPATEAGDGNKALSLEAVLAGLKPGTTHHWRLVAENKNGRTNGADQTFETGPGPSGKPVAVSFAADHEGEDPLAEYGGSSTFHGTLLPVVPGYADGKALRAEVTEPDGYARAHVSKAETGWKSGEEVWWGGAIYLEPGFYAAKQGQIDLFRWDNFEQDELTTERSGVVFQTGDKKIRLVRIKEDEPDEQHTFNLDGKEKVIGPTINEGRWYWVEVRQVLWHEDALAINELWIDGRKIAESSDRNCARSDLVVSRLRIGLAATNGLQTNDIAVRADRIRSGATPVGPLVVRPPRVAVTREMPPDRLAVHITAPNGSTSRWAADESSHENVIEGLKFSGELNGGPKELTGTLARNPRYSYPDLVAFSDAEVHGPGVGTSWDGRMDKAPESDGDRMSIDPAIVGHRAALEDNKGLIGPGFINADQSRWGDPSTERVKKLRELGKFPVASVSQAAGYKEGTEPAGLLVDFANAIAEAGKSEGQEQVFDGGGVDIGALYYDFRDLDGLGKTAGFNTQAELWTDDAASAADAGTNHEGGSASGQVVSAAGPGRKFAAIRDWYEGGFEGSMTNLHNWANLRPVGNHGLPLQGEWPDVGFTVKQMLAYAVPLYTYLDVDEEEMEDGEFVIPQAWFSEPGSMLQVVEELTKYDPLNWFVREKKFQLRFPGTYGRRWQAYAGPAGLKEQGLDASRLWRSIVVRYTDVDGSVRTVGPPGSGAHFEDPGLEITDPQHPAVQAAIPRQDVLDLNGVGVQAQAVATGERWLEEANLLSRSGSCTVSYYLLDDKGVFRPVSQVQEGDLIRFPDAHDTSYRRVASFEYDHASRSSSLSLDAPKESISALLERFNAKLASLNLS